MSPSPIKVIYFNLFSNDRRNILLPLLIPLCLPTRYDIFGNGFYVGYTNYQSHIYFFLHNYPCVHGKTNYELYNPRPHKYLLIPQRQHSFFSSVLFLTLSMSSDNDYDYYFIFTSYFNIY